jgi:hypothetical protein
MVERQRIPFRQPPVEQRVVGIELHTEHRIRGATHRPTEVPRRGVLPIGPPHRTAVKHNTIAPPPGDDPCDTARIVVRQPQFDRRRTDPAHHFEPVATAGEEMAQRGRATTVDADRVERGELLAQERRTMHVLPGGRIETNPEVMEHQRLDALCRQRHRRQQ